ncbi:RNA polymerase sigma factor [Crateriforma conspicua]|uniref:RNA polymerase sigma factor n=1 Tax=Crateriforma conspicua TaxID=2527996 RepID=A0A5C6FTF2_9PLAN|nr:sigma-70 family RNA polymerase sigma factor [Crateriforma conspicua]TWU64835.1 RNA polymerase sigma factor [Crateriforma conspicua]
MSLSEVDFRLLERCLAGAPQAWDKFVDRFLGLVIHVAHHTAQSRGLTLDRETEKDLVGEVFVVLLQNDRAVLRRFRRNCSLATYLAVIARRVIVRRLVSFQKQPPSVAGDQLDRQAATDTSIERVIDRDRVEQMILRLDPREADAVRMYHLEGKSYREIGQTVGMSENSIGSLLSRARQKLRDDSNRRDRTATESG